MRDDVSRDVREAVAELPRWGQGRGRVLRVLRVALRDRPMFEVEQAAGLPRQRLGRAEREEPGGRLTDDELAALLVHLGASANDVQRGRALVERGSVVAGSAGA